MHTNTAHTYLFLCGGIFEIFKNNTPQVLAYCPRPVILHFIVTSSYVFSFYFIDTGHFGGYRAASNTAAQPIRAKSYATSGVIFFFWLIFYASWG